MNTKIFTFSFRIKNEKSRNKMWYNFTGKVVIATGLFCYSNYYYFQLFQCGHGIVINSLHDTIKH